MDAANQNVQRKWSSRSKWCRENNVVEPIHYYWLKKIEKERKELDRNQKITNARLEGFEKGISDGETNNLNKNIQSMYKKGDEIEIITDALEIKIEYVEEIIKLNS